MNFIFDILLNFRENELYDYYEWNKGDNIKYIKKIPIFRINDNDFFNVKNNDIMIEKTMLDSIHRNSETVINKVVTVIPYSCLFSNTKEAFAVEFDSRGVSVAKGGMLLDELYDTLEKASKLKVTDIKYKIIKANNKNNFTTRYENCTRKNLKIEIKKIYMNKDIEKLKYLYYECFNDRNNDLDFIYKELENFLNKDWTAKHKYLYELIRLSYTKEVMSKNP